MTRLKTARVRARQRRNKRRDLVHAAGCTHDLCAVRRCVFDDFAIINEAMADSIRVPRTVWRRWFGKEGT